MDVLDLGPDVFALRRHDPSTGEAILALHNVTVHPVTVALSAFAAADCVDLLAGPAHSAFRSPHSKIPLPPYQVRWLRPC